MRGAERPFADFAEHLREFEQTRLVMQTFDACQCAIALDEFLYLKMFITEHCQLREMGYTKDLMGAREIPKFLTNCHAHAPADALVNFIEDQRGHFIRARQDVFESQHQT